MVISMKRYIKNKSIFGMSFPRKKALKLISDLADNIDEHIMECVVYQDMLSTTSHHWISELAVWMCKVNRIHCSSKLKERDYIDSLFSAFGTTKEDAELNLSAYYSRIHRNGYYKDYPDFEITDELIDSLFEVYTQIKSICLPILVSGEEKTIHEWIAILEPIFK